MTLEVFKSGKKNQIERLETDSDIIASLRPVERKLAESFTRIEISGKFNRRVAVSTNRVHAAKD